MTETMETLKNITRPSKNEQLIASESYDALSSVLDQIKSDDPKIEIEETKERIKIPISALRLLGEILQAMSQGKIFSLVPIATEITTQKAAEILGCSRPHLVKLLESGEIEFTKIGRHRRIKFEDVLSYKKRIKAQQKELLVEIMKSDEELELYDS